MVKQNNLLSNLKEVYVDVGPSFSTDSSNYHDLETKRLDIKNNSLDRYRKAIIEKHAKENEVVRENIESKLKFYSVGEPIIQRTEEIYQSIKDSERGYKFKRDEILKSPECLNSVRQLEGIVDVENYFKNGRIPNKVLKKFVDGLLGDNLLPIISKGLIGGALGVTAVVNLPDSQMNLINSCALIFGGIFGSQWCSYSNKNTPESLINEPAERFEEDLKWMDKTFDRIYMGGGERK